MEAKRMYARRVLQEDCMLSLPAKTQLYYYHLVLEADDDGLVDRVQSIRKMLGANQWDLTTLIDRGYLIPLPNGIIAIAHWHIFNRARKNTYTPTKYTNVWTVLEIDATGKYQLRNDPATQSDQDHTA